MSSWRARRAASIWNPRKGWRQQISLQYFRKATEGEISATLVSRTRCNAQRCCAEPGPIAPHSSLVHGPRLCSAPHRTMRRIAGSAALRPGHESCWPLTINRNVRRQGLRTSIRLVNWGSVPAAVVVAASVAAPSSVENRKSSSLVVTMFSISELARASRIGMVLIRIEGFGMRSVAAFNSASAARAKMHALSTARVSSSAAGGKRGSSLNAIAGLKVMSMPST